MRHEAAVSARGSGKTAQQEAKAGGRRSGPPGRL